MKFSAATEILNKTEFNNTSDWETIPSADYCCDYCSQIVSIDLRSLQKHQFSDFSNLNVADQQRFKEIESGKEITKSFLDFYCPTCNRTVKVYYDSWAGGKHGEVGFTIKFIAH